MRENAFQPPGESIRSLFARDVIALICAVRSRV